MQVLEVAARIERFRESWASIDAALAACNFDEAQGEADRAIAHMYGQVAWGLEWLDSMSCARSLGSTEDLIMYGLLVSARGEGLEGMGELGEAASERLRALSLLLEARGALSEADERVERAIEHLLRRSAVHRLSPRQRAMLLVSVEPEGP